MGKESEYVQHVNFYLSHKHAFPTTDLQKVNQASLQYTKCMLAALFLSISLQFPLQRLKSYNKISYRLSCTLLNLCIGHFYGLNTFLKPVFKEVYLSNRPPE